MTTNEIIKEIAVYDGYTYHETKTGDGVFAIEKKLKGNEDICHFTDLEDYLTDLNILHRLAVKVTSTIREILDFKDDLDFDLSELNNKIVSAMFTSPNEQGEHINLATALVNAIRYISANKAG